MELFLDKSFVTEDRFSVDGVLVYVALRKIMDMDIFLKNGTQTREYISINRMAFVLLGIQLKYEKAFYKRSQNCTCRADKCSDFGGRYRVFERH